MITAPITRTTEKACLDEHPRVRWNGQQRVGVFEKRPECCISLFCRRKISIRADMQVRLRLHFILFKFDEASDHANIHWSRLQRKPCGDGSRRHDVQERLRVWKRSHPLKQRCRESVLPDLETSSRLAGDLVNVTANFFTDKHGPSLGGMFLGARTLPPVSVSRMIFFFIQGGSRRP